MRSPRSFDIALEPGLASSRGRDSIRLGARRRVSAIAAVLAPVLIVAVVLAIALGETLGRYHGSLLGPIQFGRQFAAETHPPAGAPVLSPSGFDGQFFYLQALDPLLLHHSTIAAFRAVHYAYRLQRVGYPALAFVLAGGQRSAIPFGLLAVNVIVLLALSAGFALYARRRGWSTIWAVPLALTPGLLLATLRDLSDPLATATMLAGVLLWRGGRRWPAAAALTVAVLTREVMMVIVAAMAAEAALRAWRSRPRPGEWRRIALAIWPIVVVPTACFLAWQLYIASRYGGPVGSASMQPPLVNLFDELGSSLHNPDRLMAGWDVLYVGLILAACGGALVSVRRKVTITSAAACALVLSVVLPTMGDVWSDTRDTAPLFAVLLVDGLLRRNRRAVLISVAAAAMTGFVPIAIPGAF
jgi:hypothetical protein